MLYSTFAYLDCLDHAVPDIIALVPWGLSATAVKALEAFHRRQLRSVLGIKWPEKITNATLYSRCKAEPLGVLLLQARWRLFGHTLRMDPETPAQLAMASYFSTTTSRGFRGRPRTTLPVALSADLERANRGHLRSAHDLQVLQLVAADRQAWRGLVKDIADAYIEAGCS